MDLQSLVGRLNAHCRSSLEGAVGLTLSRTHYNVEIEHWLTKLVEATDNDVAAILRHFEIDTGRLAADLTKVLDRLKTGNSRSPALTPNVVKWVREAWIYGSLQYGDSSIRSGYLLVSLLGDDALSALARDASPLFARINAETLKTSLLKIVSGSSEAGQSAAASGKAATSGGAPAASPAGPAGGSALDQYTINLTARAREGKIDPVLGRDSETRQIVDILTRRRQNNPILTGEAGVGKTAVVEGFALKIAAGEVPSALKDVELLSLDLGLLQAGAGMKGEFENRLKKVIEEVKASAKPIIMFIDEAHTLIGAGGAAGQNDAANLLKPALARGEMRTIAATTWAEYKKYFERDPALTRRFQVVKVEEPDDTAAIAMMRGLIPTLERHHGVRVLAEAVEDAVRLSRRYIPSRQLPDKAVSLLDTACGRVAIASNAIPAAVEDRRRRVEMIDVDLGVLARETKIGADHATRIADLEEERVRVAEELEKLEDRWKREQDLVSRIRALHDALTAPDEAAPGEKSPEEMKSELSALTGELEALQGETPLMRVTVDSQAIAEVVGNWTGIPVGRMVSNEIKTILGLNDKLRERVIGQSHALEAIAETIRTSRAKLLDPRKPIGVFLMVGTSGVGKTETALALADILYGGERNIITINMSEYQEAHTVSALKGSPPGYVGYGEGGVLTEAVRRKPYSVVLLDEVEKAHPDVMELFFQVFDKGLMDDAEGREIDFRNTVIILTSNVGSSAIMQACLNKPAEEIPPADTLTDMLRPQLYKVFKPAFLGRLKVVPYYPLSDEMLERIIRLKLDRIAQRVGENHKARFEYDDGLVEAVLARCTEVDTGARNVDHILNGTLLPEIAETVLARMAEGTAFGKIKVTAAKDGQFKYRVS